MVASGRRRWYLWATTPGAMDHAGTIAARRRWYLRPATMSMPLTIQYVFLSISKEPVGWQILMTYHFKEHDHSYRIKPTIKFRNVQVNEQLSFEVLFWKFILKTIHPIKFSTYIAWTIQVRWLHWSTLSWIACNWLAPVKNGWLLKWSKNKIDKN